MINKKFHITAIVCSLSFLHCVAIAHSKTFDLWGKQSQEGYQGNTITTEKEVTIVNAWSNASGYTIYRIEPSVSKTQVSDRTDLDTQTSSSVESQVYKDYISAYNGLTSLMSAGKGDTPEGRKAYEKYKYYKDLYESSLKTGGGTPVKSVGDDYTFQAISKPAHQAVVLAGKWVDKSGHYVTISQNGQNMTATAEENKGRVGWKTANGVLKENIVYMNFNGWNLTGNISSQGDKISWSNNSVWTRISSSATAQPTITSDPKKDYNTFEQAIVLPCAPDTEFVRSLYQCVLHREPTAQELRAQVGRLQSGTLRQQMVADFLLGSEYESLSRTGVQFMTDACQAIYARPPTELELKSWPRTRRSVIVNDMFKDQAHLTATRNCSSLWHHSQTGAQPQKAVDSEQTQDSTASQAYKEYMDAHNAMAKLMAAGKGDTPEGRKAYTDFTKAKEKYETWLTKNPTNKGQADF